MFESELRVMFLFKALSFWLCFLCHILVSLLSIFHIPDVCWRRLINWVILWGVVRKWNGTMKIMLSLPVTTWYLTVWRKEAAWLMIVLDNFVLNREFQLSFTLVDEGKERTGIGPGSSVLDWQDILGIWSSSSNWCLWIRLNCQSKPLKLYLWGELVPLTEVTFNKMKQVKVYNASFLNVYSKKTLVP